MLWQPLDFIRDGDQRQFLKHLNIHPHTAIVVYGAGACITASYQDRLIGFSVIDSAVICNNIQTYHEVLKECRRRETECTTDSLHGYCFQPIYVNDSDTVVVIIRSEELIDCFAHYVTLSTTPRCIDMVPPTRWRNTNEVTRYNEKNFVQAIVKLYDVRFSRLERVGTSVWFDEFSVTVRPCEVMCLKLGQRVIVAAVNHVATGIAAHSQVEQWHHGHKLIKIVSTNSRRAEMEDNLPVQLFTFDYPQGGHCVLVERLEMRVHPRDVVPMHVWIATERLASAIETLPV